jgi:hypothetical protein
MQSSLKQPHAFVLSTNGLQRCSRPLVDTNTQVRISGWLLFDLEHVNVVGKQRATAWEIHPITRIEVKQNGQWIDLDSDQWMQTANAHVESTSTRATDVSDTTQPGEGTQASKSGSTLPLALTTALERGGTEQRSKAST